MPDWFEREEQAIEEQYERGEISLKEYNDALSDLRRSYRDAAEESAQRAYEEEKARW